MLLWWETLGAPAGCGQVTALDGAGRAARVAAMRYKAVLGLCGFLLATPATADPWTACARAIAAAERGSGIPPGLLLAIARVESGRAMPRSGDREMPRSGDTTSRAGGGVAPWPFAINADGTGRFPESRDAAITEVEGLRSRGIASVDVGCMQVNLFHHAMAFPTLEAAFDPTSNVAYAVRFLRELRARTGN